jgi:hypothetical protein
MTTGVWKKKGRVTQGEERREKERGGGCGAGVESV